MIPLSVAYNALVFAFALGVRRAAGATRSLRIVAGLLFAYGLASLAGPFVPMQLRGSEMALTDVLYITCTVVIVAASLLAIGFGAASLGRRFRIYSIATMVAVVGFGFLAGMQGSRIAEGLATPWVGVTERINIHAILAWMAVPAIALVQREPVPEQSAAVPGHTSAARPAH